MLLILLSAPSGKQSQVNQLVLNAICQIASPGINKDSHPMAKFQDLVLSCNYRVLMNFRAQSEAKSIKGLAQTDTDAMAARKWKRKWPTNYARTLGTQKAGTSKCSS